MGGFQLPMPQMIPGGGGVSSGGVVGPNPGAQNNGAAQFGQALTQLLTGAAAFQKGRISSAKADVDKTIADLSSGTTTLDMIDQKQLLKKVKLAYPMLKTSFTPEELAAQEHAKQIQQVDQENQQNAQIGQQLAQGGQALSGMPGALGMLGSQMQQMQPPPPMAPPPMAAPAPASSPGVLDRLRGIIPGMHPPGPQPTMNSPVGQMLQRVAQEGAVRHQAAQEDEAITHKLMMAGKAAGAQDATNQLQLGGQLFQRMLQGDPTATELLYKTGHLKEMPIDQMVSITSRANPGMPLDKAQQQAAQTLLFMQTGGAQLKGQMMGLVEKMLPYYGGDPNRAMAALQDPVNGPKPTLSVEDNEKLWTGMTKIMDAYQDVPINIVSQYAHASVAGNKELANNVLNFISTHYKRTLGDKSSREWAGLGVDQKRLDLTGRQIDGELRIRGAAEETQRLRALMEGLKEIGKPAEHIYLNQDKFTPAQVLESAQLLADTNKDVAKLLKAYGGVAPTPNVREQGGFERGAHLFGPATPSIGVQAPQGDWFSGMMGQRPGASTPQSNFTPIVENIKSQLRSLPKASREAILSQMALPPQVKQELSTWDPEAEQLSAISDFALRNQKR